MITQYIDIMEGEHGSTGEEGVVNEWIKGIREGTEKREEKKEELKGEGGQEGGAGQMEEQIGRGSRELSRVEKEKMLQAKAERSGRKCPVCERMLVRNKAGTDDRELVRSGEGEKRARLVREEPGVDVSSGACAWAGEQRLHAWSAGDGDVDGKQDAGGGGERGDGEAKRDKHVEGDLGPGGQRTRGKGARGAGASECATEHGGRGKANGNADADRAVHTGH
jgi:hypothetical protein